MKKFLLKSSLFFSVVLASLFLTGLYPKTVAGSSDYMAAIIDKHLQIDKTASPKIFLGGGSNLAFGIESRKLEQTLGMPVINMGLHGGLGLTFMLNELKYSAKENDIIFLSIEYLLDENGENGLKLYTRGYFPPARNFYHTNFILDCKSYLSNNQKIFRSFFVKHNPRSSIYSRTAFNINGDVVSHLNKAKPQNLDTRGKLSYQYWNGIAKINEFNQYAISKNICVFFLFPPYAASQFEKDRIVIHKLEADVRKNLKVEILNSPKDFAYPDSLFFDTVYHLDIKGRKRRTEETIRLIEKNTAAQKCIEQGKLRRNVLLTNHSIHPSK